MKKLFKVELSKTKHLSTRIIVRCEKASDAKQYSLKHFPYWSVDGVFEIEEKEVWATENIYSA